MPTETTIRQIATYALLRERIRRIAAVGFCAGLALLLGCASTVIPDEGDETEVNRPVEPDELQYRDSDGQLVGLPERAVPDDDGTLSRADLQIPLIEIKPESDYEIGSGDRVVARVNELKLPGKEEVLSLVVGSTGKVSVPLAGEIELVGLTQEQARLRIVERLKPYIRDPQVSLEITGHLSKRVQLHGAVAKTGTFSFPKNRLSIMEALSLSGGLASNAGTRVVITRAHPDGGAEQFLIDLEALMSDGPEAKAALQMYIRPGDVINVPPADQVFVMGYVHRPGSYSLKRRMTALELIAQAGGPLARAASASESWLRRRKSNGSFRIVKLDVEKIMAGQSTDVVLVAGDTIMVPQTGSLFAATEGWSLLRGRVASAVPGPR